MSDSSFKSEFDIWKKKNDQHGKQAFSRFVMLKFLQSLQSQSEDFVFKGGNLLWHYIKTPRETIDLDLATLKIKSHSEVREILNATTALHQDIKYKIKQFKELDGKDEVRAAVIVTYETSTGQKNQFTIDIVYALPTDVVKIKSTIGKKKYVAASMENIISDKLTAAHRFRSGNTRMKDFDDLWRISKSDLKIKKIKLKRLLRPLKERALLDHSWIEFLEASWKRHAKSYKDVPRDLSTVFEDVNTWLERLLS
jgi:hypothetical protein